MPSTRANASESLVEAAALSAVDLFKDLPVACLRALEQGSELRDFRTGYVFFRAGESGQRLLLHLEATSFRHLIPRIARLLLDRAQGEYVEDLTHQEIAEHLRVYRESVTAALGELRKAGIIAVDRKLIRILNRLRLERAARE